MEVKNVISMGFETETSFYQLLEVYEVLHW